VTHDRGEKIGLVADHDPDVKRGKDEGQDAGLDVGPMPAENGVLARGQTGDASENKQGQAGLVEDPVDCVKYGVEIVAGDDRLAD
jgi:hypothetical protein